MGGIHIGLWIAAGCYFAALAAFLLRRPRISVILLAAGFAAHGFYQVLRGWIGGIFIPNGMFEGVFLLPLVLALLVLVMRIFSREQLDWESGVIPACLFMVFALLYPKGIIPPTPNKITVWANLFFAFEIAGHACFYLGAWFALLGLREGTESRSFHRLIVWGFVLYSAAQITGAVWAYIGWASTFRWGSRHLQSAVLWCFYAAYLHLRFMPRWDARKRMKYAAAGFFIVMLCSIGSYINEMKFPRIGG